MTRDEMIALLRGCAQKLKRNPSFEDLRRVPAFRVKALYKHFAGLGEALEAAGLEPRGPGFKTATAELMLEWAAVARRLKSIPTADQYRRHGRFSTIPFARRFGGWLQVPRAFRRFARQQGIESQWPDVLQMIMARDFHANRALRLPSVVVSHARAGAPLLQRKIRADRPVYGAALRLPGLGREPVNEAGVIYLFGMIAHQLGFIVERIQPGFPDCEALYEAEPGKWQRLRIEFEYSSRNFARHRHRQQECDVIVCWVHDWPECPAALDVIELKRIVKRL